MTKKLLAGLIVASVLIGSKALSQVPFRTAVKTDTISANFAASIRMTSPVTFARFIAVDSITSAPVFPDGLSSSGNVVVNADFSAYNLQAGTGGTTGYVYLFDASGGGYIWIYPASTGAQSVYFPGVDGAADSVAYRALTRHVIRKTADETITSTSTLQDDDHLSFSATANTSYAVKFYLRVYPEDVDVGGLKCDVISPSGSNETLSYYGEGTSGWMSGESFPVSGVGNPGVGGAAVFVIEGIITTGGTAGAIKLQWAQTSSSAFNTTVKAGSYLSYQKVW